MVVLIFLSVFTLFVIYLVVFGIFLNLKRKINVIIKALGLEYVSAVNEQSETCRYPWGWECLDWLVLREGNNQKALY